MIKKKMDGKKPFYKKWWVITIVAFLLLGVIATITESDESKAERISEEQAKVDAKELAEMMKKNSTITQEEFNKLEKGMSFDEVIKTVGGKPEDKHEISSTIMEYRYKGENGVSDESKADLLFVNEKLDTIMESGLVTEIKELTKEEQAQADKNFADIQGKVSRNIEKSEIEKIITDKIGSTTNTDKARIVEVVSNDLGNGEKTIAVTLNASENFTHNSTRRKMWMDSTEILEPLSSIKGVQNISVEWLYPLVDQYGNESDGRIMLFDFPKEVFEKVNWDNFNFENLPNVSEGYFEHPALSK